LGISYEQGIFHDGPSVSDTGKKKKKSNISKYLASSKVLGSHKALLSKLVQFVKLTPSGNKVKRDSNDMLVVNIRIIQLTGTGQAAGCTTIPLNNGKTIVSLFGRSCLHFLRILEALVKATVGHESVVNANRGEYNRMFKCNYIVVQPSSRINPHQFLVTLPKHDQLLC